MPFVFNSLDEGISAALPDAFRVTTTAVNVGEYVKSISKNPPLDPIQVARNKKIFDIMCTTPGVFVQRRCYT